jgi:hypothetical protein
VHDCTRYGIEFYDTNCVRGWVESNKIYDCDGAAGRGIYAAQDRVTIKNNHIDTVTKMGVDIRGDYCQVVGNRIYNCGDTGISVNTCNYTLVEGNYIDTSVLGIHMTSSTYTRIVGNMMVACSNENISGYVASDYITDNYPFIDEVYGSATMLNGNSTVTIAHGITDGDSGLVPDCVLLTGVGSEMTNISPTTVNAANIIVTNHDGAVTGDRTLYYHAKWKPP